MVELWRAGRLLRRGDRYADSGLRELRLTESIEDLRRELLLGLRVWLVELRRPGGVRAGGQGRWRL